MSGAIFLEGNRVDNLFVAGGSGGGASAPTFSETVIATGTNASTLVFTGDYTDYDLLKFVCVNSSSGKVIEILTTPSTIEAIRAVRSVICFNEYANTQYCNYRFGNTTSSNWTYSASRNLYISEVRGLTCTNGTITETEIYNRGAYTTTEVSITGKTGLLDYDMIFLSAAYDEIQPNVINIVKPFGETSSSVRDAVINPYSKSYNIRITDTDMTASYYFYVVGIKFT
jgi:hypothetical protein